MSSHPQAEHTPTDSTTPPRRCLNCGTPLHGPYCSRCGQHDIDYHRSFHHLAHDVLENLFHFEGKFFTSVAWLLAKPGKLTVDFNAGRRQSQVQPLRLYIFVTLLFFLVVHLLNHGHLFDRGESERAGSQIQQITKGLKGADKLTDPQAELFGQLLTEAMEAKQGPVDSKTVAELVDRVRRERPAPEKAPKAPPKSRRGEPDAKTGPRFEQRFKEKFEGGEITAARFLDALESRIPTLLFIGMPVLALLLKLLYWRRHRYYIEHLIFSIHLHTWVFLVLVVGMGYLNLAAFGPHFLKPTLQWLLVAWMIGYAWVACRTVYGQGWMKTGIKLGLLAVSYFTALGALLVILITSTIIWLVMT